MVQKRYWRLIKEKKYHVGVYDRVLDKVLHATHKDGKLIYQVCSRYFFDAYKEGLRDSYENIGFSEKEIEERWNNVARIISGTGTLKFTTANGKDITHTYDVSGLSGLNCESIVEYVLNGKLKEPRGDWLKPLVAIGIIGKKGKLFGLIDLGSSNSTS